MNRDEHGFSQPTRVMGRGPCGYAGPPQKVEIRFSIARGGQGGVEKKDEYTGSKSNAE